MFGRRWLEIGFTGFQSHLVPSSHRQLLTNAASIIGTTGITAILGYAYWTIAARLCSPEQVGLATAILSAITMIGNLSALGLGTVVVTEAARWPARTTSLVVASLIVSAVVALIVASVLAGVAPLVFRDLSTLYPDGGYGFGVVVAAVLTAVALMADQTAIGLLRGNVQFARNTIASAVKLCLLPATAFVFGASSAMILLTWILGIVISLVVSGLLVRPCGIAVADVMAEFRRLRSLVPTAMAHHVLNLALLTPGLLLPIVVTGVLSAEQNAYFYVAWIIAAFVFVVPGALATSTYAVAARDIDALPKRLRLTLLCSVLTGIAALPVVSVAGPVMLAVFGTVYATNASIVLDILVLAVFPLLVKDHYITVRRVQRRVGGAALMVVAGTALEIGGAMVGAVLGGLVGVAIGWVVGVSIEASCVLLPVIRASSARTSTGWPAELEDAAIPSAT